MQYFVIWPDGQKFGPADVSQLNQWAQENRINPDTDLESVVDGARMKAGSVAGINFPAAAPQSAPAADPSPAQPAQTGYADNAKYYVIGTGGQKFGPADAATLTQWAAENRLTQSTELEHAETGARIQASMVSGITFPSSGQPSTPSSPYANTGPAQSPYAATPGPSNYPRGTYGDPDAGKTEAILSFVFSGIGFICCPCLFSSAGIVLGVLSKNKGHKWGNTAIILGVASFVLGIVLGVISNLVFGGGFDKLMPK